MRQSHSNLGGTLQRIALIVAMTAALLAAILPAATCFAQDAAKPKSDSAQAKPRMEVSDLRTRLYAISQMIQTGRLAEAEQGIAM